MSPPVHVGNEQYEAVTKGPLATQDTRQARPASCGAFVGYLMKLTSSTQSSKSLGVGLPLT